MSEKKNINSLTQDFQGIDRDYRYQVTVVTARPKIVQAFFLAWTGAVVCMGIFFITVMGWYGAQGLFQDSAYKQSVLKNAEISHEYIKSHAPQALRIGGVQSVPTGSGNMYDVYAEIENPNDRHGVTFSYTCTTEQDIVLMKTGFLNPGEKNYFIGARASSGKPKSPSCVIKDISWKYLKKEHIPNVRAWYAEHAEFAIADVQFTRDIAYTDATVSRSLFTITNHTPYGYWEPMFVVRIMRGATVLGIADITASRLRPGEERVMDMRWFGDLPQTATVTVSPRIPFFLPEAYMPPETSQALDARDRLNEETR